MTHQDDTTTPGAPRQIMGPAWGVVEHIARKSRALDLWKTSDVRGVAASSRELIIDPRTAYAMLVAARTLKREDLGECVVCGDYGPLVVGDLCVKCDHLEGERGDGYEEDDDR